MYDRRLHHTCPILQGLGIIWHVIEHDRHHGGELSFSLGMHGLAALDI
jgi:hypothetical protein